MQLICSKAGTSMSFQRLFLNLRTWVPSEANDSGGSAFAWCKPPAADP
jgi:hypothetical protein